MVAAEVKATVRKEPRDGHHGRLLEGRCTTTILVTHTHTHMVLLMGDTRTHTVLKFKTRIYKMFYVNIRRKKMTLCCLQTDMQTIKVYIQIICPC